MRYGSINIVEPRRKRKLNLLQGESVAPEEIEDYAETDVDTSVANLKKKQNMTQDVHQVKTIKIKER